MGLPPWELSDGQLFALITGANSGLGISIATRLIDELFTSPAISPKKHLILILCTRSPIKTRLTISRLRAHLRKLVDYSSFAAQQRKTAKAQGKQYKWQDQVQRVHFLGVEADLCDLKSVYAVADRLVNSTVGSPDATTMDGGKLPYGSPGTKNYSSDILQDRWALSQEEESTGVQRSWGWGLGELRIPRLDSLFLIAGMGGWTGINWVAATRDIFLDTVDALTYPQYKLSKVGSVVRTHSPIKITTSDEAPQTQLHDQVRPKELSLGEVFCSNVFGHYILAHELMPLLSRPATTTCTSGGKIIWMSSLEGLGDSLSIDDIQGLKSMAPYESSKRLIDILVLTADLPSVQRVSAPFFDPLASISMEKLKIKSREENASVMKPTNYLAHPGIFISDIMPLPGILIAIYKFISYVARWLGSPWHNIDPYQAAAAPVWLSLTESEVLEGFEGTGASKMKLGSAIDSSGNEWVMKTEVPGWGWDGKLESKIDAKTMKGRRKGAVDLTKEAKEEFEVLGGECWRQMEELRKEWEIILGLRDNGK